MYVMISELISAAFFLNPFRQCVCVSLVSVLSLLGKGSINCILPFAVRQRLGINFPAAMNACNNRTNVEQVCLWFCLCMPIMLLDNNSVKPIPRQRRFVGGFVSCAIRVVTKEKKILVFARTSCNYLIWEICIFLWIFIRHLSIVISRISSPRTRVNSYNRLERWPWQWLSSVCLRISLW
jgi:hypothetical protein